MVIERSNSNRTAANNDDTRIVSVKCGLNHTAALSKSGHVYVWGKFCGGRDNGKAGKDDGSESNQEGPVVDAFFPHKFSIGGLDSGIKPKSIACSTHQTAVLMSDNSIWVNGIVKLGRGEVAYDFIRVVRPDKWSKRKVELFGGFHTIALVDSKEAYYVELLEPEESYDEQEETEKADGDLNLAKKWGNVEKVDFIGEDNIGTIKSIETGWKFGAVLVEEESL